MEKRLFATREKHGDDWKLYLPLLNYMHVYEKKYIREIICTAKIQIIKKKNFISIKEGTAYPLDRLYSIMFFILCVVRVHYFFNSS